MAQYRKPAWEIEQQADELAQIKKEMQAYGTPDFATSWSLESIENVEVQLRDEAKAAQLFESHYELELSLNGDPVNKHTINSKFFGGMLVYIQDCLNALAYSQVSNAASRKNLIAGNRLVLAATGPGSFEAKFVIPEGTTDEERLLDVPVSLSPIATLSRLLDSSIDIDDSSEILASQQVKVKYGLIIDLLAKNGADISMRTKGNMASVRMSAQEARDRREWLDLLQTEVEEKSFTGILTGGSIETGRFELKTNERIIRGRVSENALGQIRKIRFGMQVVASVQVTVTTHEDTNFMPRTLYFLNSIQADDDPVLF